MYKKILSILTLLLMVVTIVSCNVKDQNTFIQPLSADDFNVWTVSSVEKVLQSQDITEDLLDNNSISLCMFQNEYEAYQVIVTTEKEIEELDISISDLYNGNNKISSDNVSILFEKYLTVSQIFDEETNAQVGYYPDCLVPMETIKEYKENTVEAGKNQGIYFKFKTEKNQAPGVYTGNININCDGIETLIPVQIEVYDIAVSDERHNKSIFLVDRNFYSGELNSSQDMMDKYIEALFAYRLSPDIITIEDPFSDIDYYIEKAYEFMQDDRCTNITIPYYSCDIEDLEIFPNGGYYTCFNVELFKNTVMKYIEKSMEKQFDMIKKSICYFAFVDESVDNRLTASLKVTGHQFKLAIQDIIDNIKLQYEPTDFREQLIESVSNLKFVQTDAYISDDYSEYVDTWCPKVSYYHSENDRKAYDSQKEKWWYTCILPRAPYPTYHIEDTLLSARLLSWMQEQYNVTGNLYWSVNLYALYNGANYESIDNYFTGDAERFKDCNGDGFLFYPGGQYGLDYPLSSMRLEAIRDGLEEYELLYSIREYCNELNNRAIISNVEKVISNLTSKLYQGTKIHTDNSDFEDARLNLKNMLDCIKSSAGMTILDIIDDGYGTLSYKIYVNEGYELKKDNTLLTNYATVEGGRIYYVDLQLNQSVNSMNLSFTCDNTNYNYPILAYGKIKSYDGDILSNSIKLDTENTGSKVSSKEVVSGESISQDGSFVQINIRSTNGTVSKKDEQCIILKGGFVSEINSKVNKIVLHIYSNAEEENINIKYKTNTLVADLNLEEYEIHKGLNTIVIDTSSIKWNSNTEFEYLKLIIGDSNSAQDGKILYLKDAIVYGE